jgi:hypothetical protein
MQMYISSNYFLQTFFFLLLRAQEFFQASDERGNKLQTSVHAEPLLRAFPKEEVRRDKILLRLKFGENVICYFCAVWLENEARLLEKIEK